MSLADAILKMPCWYALILIVFSLYYAIRGVMEQSHMNKILEWQKNPNRHATQCQRVIIDYIQEFIFKFVITSSAFLAIFLANHIFISLNSINDIGTGTAVLLIFLLIWGVTGISGYLTFLIITGKFPKG
jgi:hypothetical protein